MGKGGSKPASSQTVTSTPYLKKDVGYAAAQARNLYQGYTPEMNSISGQISSLNEQIANLQQKNQMPLYNRNYDRKFDREDRLELLPYEDPNLKSLITQRDALQGQLNTLSPDTPKYFPGQTYVDYSPETIQGLTSIAQRATDGSPLMGASKDAILNTVQGNYLNANPYLDQVINSSLDEVTKKYRDQILPGLASNFAASGRYGSGIQQSLTSDAIGNLGKEAMGVASGLRYDNYNNERARQLNAAAMAPSLAQSDYYDAQQLLGVGSAREALSQAKLQDEMDRFNFYENQPSILLDQYINRIGALNSGSGTTTTTGTMANRASPISGAISGGLGGLSLGSTLAPMVYGGGIAGSTPFMASIGGPLGIGLGVGGALLGGLFS